jgi:CheY-like chemotaxis protein
MQNPPTSISLRLAIVDSAPQDYGHLLEAVGAGNPLAGSLSLHFLASGRDALQFARRWRAGLWVVNSRLNDMSGFTLAETLRSTRPSALIFLIGDEYFPADESRTLSMGFAKYLCKPLDPCWVLPLEGSSSISLSAFRSSVRPAQTASKRSADAPDVLSFASAASWAESSSAHVILPFAEASEQRPAA